MMHNVLWIPGAADLVQHVNQRVLAVGFESNVEVDCDVGRRVAHGLPSLRDGIPGVLCVHVVPTW